MADLLSYPIASTGEARLNRRGPVRWLLLLAVAVLLFTTLMVTDYLLLRMLTAFIVGAP